MTIPTSLGRVSPNAIRIPVAPNHLAQPPQPQATGPRRQVNISSLRPDGSIAQTRRVVPMTPLFDEAFLALAHGSLIDTPNGPVAIEDLQPGDTVSSASGDTQTILWKGSTLIVPGRPDGAGHRQTLTRIMADSFGLQRPMGCVVAGSAARLLHTPAHLRVRMGDVRILTPVRDCVDGMSVIETAPPTPVELFHICLSRHALIRVAGLDFETYHPGNQLRHMTDKVVRDQFLDLFPHIRRANDFGPLCHPRSSTRDDEFAAKASA